MNRRKMIGVLLGSVAVASLSQGTEAALVDKSEGNKRVIRKLIERVWRNGHIDELPNFWTVDCVNHADPSPDNQGLAAIRLYHESFATWFRDFDEVLIEVEQQIAQGDRVATQMLLRATHKTMQRKVSLATIRIDRLTHDKIAEHWSIADMAGFAQQLG